MRRPRGWAAIGAAGFTITTLFAAGSAAAAPALVSACTGASLPPSRLTGVVTPLVNGVFGTIGGDLGIPLLGAPAVITSALSGAPIGLDVLTTGGTVLAPGAQCSEQASGFTLLTPKGITIGGNSIDGLGGAGLNANAGEIGSIALGNTASTAVPATNAIALGTGATVTGASPNAVAIGSGATATTPGGVALGGGSVDRPAVASGGATIAGTPYVFAGAAPTGVVSVGAPGAERQLVNVAAGQLTAGSTDAVTGSQLFATNTAVNSLASGGAGPVQYANAATPTAPNGGVPSQDLTLVGAAAGTPVSLHNVNAGVVAAGSTDAVNGGQLFATNQSISNILGGKAGPFASDNTAGAPNALAGGVNSTAGGFGASATGAGSAAVGNGATDNGVAGSTVLGAGANVGAGLAGTNTALGQGATVAAAATPTPTGIINGKTYTFAGGAPTGAVSIGGVGTEHQLQNVAAGQLSATSTNAVNGSQLYSTNAALAALTGSMGGVGTAGGAGSTAIGAGSTTTAGATNGVALGNGATTSTAGGAAIGAGSVAATGGGVAAYVPAVASGADATGVRATNSTTGAVSVGNAGANVLRQITGVAGGTNATDAANVAQLRAVSDAVTSGAVGPVQYSSATAPTTPNGGAPSQDLTLVGAAAGTPVGLHNLAAGTANSDAATVGQLNTGLAGAVATSNAYTNQVAGVLLTNIHDVARQAYSGVAAAMALESAPYVAGKWTYAAGVGYYNDYASVGGSLRRTSDNGRWSVTAGIAGGTYGGVAARVGIAGVLN